jgi:hypothetical protein
MRIEKLMRLAVISKENDVLIEVSPEVFRKNLAEYSKTREVGEAFDFLCNEIKERTKSL